MSRMGISIIIVGIGDANFDMMEELDSDDQVSKLTKLNLTFQLLTASNGRASRDIVQFVPFRDFRHQVRQGEALAAAVLEELPYQVTSYFRSIGKKPGNAPKATNMQNLYCKFKFQTQV